MPLIKGSFFEKKPRNTQKVKLGINILEIYDIILSVNEQGRLVIRRDGSMEEINLKDLFNFFVKKIPLMMLITIFIFAVGIVYTMVLKTPLYKGDTTLILVKKEDADSSSSLTQNDIVLNQKLVATYSVIIKSRRVLNQVISQLKLNESTKELSKKVTVSNKSDTEIIQISVRHEDPKRAAQIADSIADVFKHEVMEIYSLENVTIIDEAEVQSTPYNIQLGKSFLLFFAAGLVVAGGVVFAIYYFDTSIKSSEEVENRLGIPVIGNIPVSGKGVK